MNKFSKEQIQKIKKVHAEITDLQKTQDKLFDSLVKELDLEKYAQAWREDSDCYIFKDDNPTSWLFDTVFNTDADDVDKSIADLEKHWSMYDQRD